MIIPGLLLHIKRIHLVILFSKPKHPRCKKGVAKYSKGLVEKDVKSNGQPRPPAFDRYKSFGYDDLTPKHWYFKCSRLPDVDGIKIFDKDDQATQHHSFHLYIYGLVIFIKNFDIRRS